MLGRLGLILSSESGSLLDLCSQPSLLLNPHQLILYWCIHVLESEVSACGFPVIVLFIYTHSIFLNYITSDLCKEICI